MRYLFYPAILAGFLAGSTCFATEYIFTFNAKDGRQLKIKMEGDTKWEAMEHAGVLCGKLFGIKPGISEDRLADILDTCANPSFD